MSEMLLDHCTILFCAAAQHKVGRDVRRGIEWSSFRTAFFRRLLQEVLFDTVHHIEAVAKFDEAITSVVEVCAK